MKNILVLYYSQTGQLKKIVDSIARSWLSDEAINVDFINYKPQNDFPFPWSSDAFFDVFPESREGIPCALEPLNFSKEKEYDLVVLAYQVWYLSPSIPVWSLLQDASFAEFIKGKPVLTVLGVRNMWTQAHYKVQTQLKKLQAKPVGNMVFSDPTNNFVSVITVIHWLIDGQQGPIGIWPRSGVPEKRIEEASSFGVLIKNALLNQQLEALQEKIVLEKGVDINFVLKTIEFNGYRIFGVWSKFILKKGKAGDPKRLGRVRFFKYYLLFMIFILSPLASILFWIISLLFYPWVQKHLQKVALLQ